MRLFLIMVLCIASPGCGSDEEVSRAPQLVLVHKLFTADYESACEKLLPKAEQAVEKLTGVEISPRLRFVDTLPAPAQQAVALRTGDFVNIRRSYAQVATRRQLYNTLCHEMLHMAHIGDIFTKELVQYQQWTQEKWALFKLRSAFDEGLSWRYAAELSAEKFGGKPYYYWDYVPASPVSRDVIVRTVMRTPEVALQAARDEKFAASFLWDHSRGRNKRKRK